MRSPICRITIGDRLFYSGDGRLTIASVSLGEDARSSTCRFEVYDPELKLAGEYFQMSYTKGGIQVPSDLLSSPPPPAAALDMTSALGTAPAAGSPGSSEFSPGDANEQIILAECARQGITDPHQVAYILGTAYHESDRYNTLEEYASGADYEGRTDLGNTEPGDGVRYKGRGYVQLTGRVNYEKYEELTGQPLVSQPELLQQDAGLAAFVLVHGMRTGHFTGVGLDDFGSGGSFDFYGARAIVNHPSSVPGLVAGYAEEYLARIQSGELAIGQPEPPPASPAEPIAQEEDPDTTEPESDPPPEEVSIKGTEIIVEFGFRPEKMTRYHFIHTGTKATAKPPYMVAFTGKSIRWEMSRRTVNATWQNITLRDLVETICEDYGRDLEMEGDGPTYAHLDATGISYMELLLRECRAIGYRISDDGNTLKLSPWRPEFTGFVITPDIFISADFADRASSDRSQVPTPEETPDQPDNAAADATLEVNAESGGIEQANPEDLTGVEGQTIVTTGSPTAAMHGVVADPETGDESVAKAQSDILQGLGNAAVGAVKSAIGEAANALPDNPLPAATGILPESITGLPTQQIGSIDLADGSATGEAIRDESRRVKGYESSATIRTTPAALALAPGSIIAIADRCFKNAECRKAFAKEWRVSTVKHVLRAGKLETSLTFYTPQAQRPEPPPSPPNASPTSTLTTQAQPGEVLATNLTPGTHISPMAPGWSSCGAVCEFGYARGRLHAGLDFGGYSPDEVWATMDGTIASVVDDNSSGAGRYVEIEHPDGSATRYLHLVDIIVSQGQQVAQGQQIATRGGSGMGGEGIQIDGGGYDVHLHFEIYPQGFGGAAVDPRSVIDL